MGPALDRRFAARFQSLAVDVLLGDDRATRSAVELADDLLAAGAEGPATVAVAALPRAVGRSEADEPVRQMLAEHDLAVPDVRDVHDGDDRDDERRYRALLVAFALWDLPTPSFVRAFHARLPAWDQQTALDRELVLLLEDREHEGRPAVRTAIEEQMRAAVRRRSPVSEVAGRPAPDR